MQNKRKNNQLTSSRKVGMRDINALLHCAPISRIKTLRDDEARRAFTLIELLVVVLIIGILAAVAVPQYQKAVDKARVSELFAILQNIKVQQEVFFLTNGSYAADCEELGADLPEGFKQDIENPTYYILTRGNYITRIRCSNVSTRIQGKLTDQEDSFRIVFELFFDHPTGREADAARMFCDAPKGDSRSLTACKSLCKEPKATYSCWIK